MSPMINSISSNQDSFKFVEFRSGFNMILADRTATSSVRDSRNGLGKSTLIQIIHFCLGAAITKGTLFKETRLSDWSFSLNLTLAGKEMGASH